MSFVIAFLTFILFLVCLLLCLLILVQLPKKEAGMGTAFGGDAAVAMFGAGSGNALTRMTKYTAGIFLVLCVLLTALNAAKNRSRSSAIERELSKTGAAAPANAAAQPFSSLLAPSATNAAGATSAGKAASNSLQRASEAVTNAVKAVVPATNPAPTKN
jgi:preprotein translocase subunit SecG